MTQDELRARRETIVREHMADEIDHAWDKVLATFPHPHYEIIATGAVHDGRPDVERYYTTSRQTFPDQRNTLLSLRHLDDGIVVEFILERVTNVSMGVEIDAITEFEEILDVPTGAVDAKARVLEPV